MKEQASTPTIPTISTLLVLDLDMIMAFGPHGTTYEPIDASPFSFLVLSSYEYAWGNSGIIELKQGQVLNLNWHIKTFSQIEYVVTTRDVNLTFRVIDNPKSPTDLAGYTWGAVFDGREGISLKEPLEVQIEVSNVELDPTTPVIIEPTKSLITKSPLEVMNNFTYSISFTLIINGDPYYLRIDPLIKNNSNGPTSFPKG